MEDDDSFFVEIGLDEESMADIDSLFAGSGLDEESMADDDGFFAGITLDEEGWDDEDQQRQEHQDAEEERVLGIAYFCRLVLVFREQVVRRPITQYTPVGPYRIRKKGVTYAKSPEQKEKERRSKERKFKEKKGRNGMVGVLCSSLALASVDARFSHTPSTLELAWTSQWWT